MKKITIVMIGLMCCTTSFAEFKAKGWQWYKEVPYIDYSKIHKHYQEAQKTDSNLKPSQQLKAIQDDYKEVHSYAVMHPEDVQAVAADKAYINYFYDKSLEYSISGKKANLMYPQLSGELKNPTSQLAQQILTQQNQKDQDEAISKAVSHNFGIFWFYKGKDPIAQAMAPSIQQFADEYNISLIGVSMDNTAINAIKNNRSDQGQAKTFDVKAYPAVFLINPDKREYFPVAYGFASIDQIKQSLVNIVTQYGKDKLDA